MQSPCDHELRNPGAAPDKIISSKAVVHPLTGVPGPQRVVCVRQQAQRMAGCGSSLQVAYDRALPGRLSRSGFDYGRVSARGASTNVAFEYELEASVAA
jgi:hypothetical protein